MLTSKRLSLRSLSAKYQQTSNSSCNDAIAPSMVGYMIMNFFGYILSFIRKYYAQTYGEDFILARITVDVSHILFETIII